MADLGPLEDFVSSPDEHGAANDRFAGAVDPSIPVNTSPQPPPSSGPVPESLMNQNGGVTGPSRSLAPETTAAPMAQPPATNSGPSMADIMGQIQAAGGLGNLPKPQQLAILQQITSSTPGLKLDPQLQMQRRRGGMLEQIGLENQAAAAQEKARLEANILADHNNKLEEQLKLDAAKTAEDDAKIQEWSGKYEDALKQRMAMPKINPNRFNERLGVGGQIMAAIAQGLGAFGAAITHSPNYAMELIQKAIDRDIHAQEQELADATGNVDLLRNGLAYFRAKGLDTRQAQLAERSARWQQVQQKLSEAAAQTGSQQMLGTFQQLIGAAQQKQAEADQQAKLLEMPKLSTQTVRGLPSSGPNIGDIDKLHGMSERDTTIKQFQQAREASNRFRALVDAGADGAAIMDFIATGMKQGSFTPTFIDMLKKRGLVDKAGEAARAAFEGGYDPQLIQTLQRALDANTAVSMKAAEPKLRQLQALGLPLSLSIGGTSTAEKAMQAGAKPLE